MTSKAYLLRPDTPEEGVERPLRPGESPGQLAPHLAENARDAGLVNMKRPDWRPNSPKVLQAIEHAKRAGIGNEARDAFYVAY